MGNISIGDRVFVSYDQRTIAEMGRVEYEKDGHYYVRQDDGLAYEWPTHLCYRIDSPVGSWLYRYAKRPERLLKYLKLG